MIDWGKITKGSMKKINAIARRAVLENDSTDYLGTVMDLQAAHTHGNPLDLDKLMEFETFDFWHDVNGINRHLNRETGELENCFSPRCSRV